MMSQQRRPALDEIERILRNLLGRDVELPSQFNIAGMLGQFPLMDLYTDPQAWVIECEVPGLTREDLQLTLEGDRLIIKGEAEPLSETDRARRSYEKQERHHGSFVRDVELPESVDPDEIEAHCENGLLTIRIPLPEPKGVKELMIE